MDPPRRWLWPASESFFLRHENYRNICYERPPYARSDVIAAGSDDDLSASERKAKRQRIIRLSKSFISGNPLFIASAALRGPFHGHASHHRANQETKDVLRSEKRGLALADSTSPTVTRHRRSRPQVVPRRHQQPISSNSDKSTPTPANVPRTVRTVSAVLLSHTRLPCPSLDAPARDVEPESVETPPHNIEPSHQIQTPRFEEPPPTDPTASLSRARQLSQGAIAATLDQIGIQHAKTLSQRALKRNATENCRRTGKLPSLNRFTPLSKIQTNNRHDLDAESPFVFRKIVREGLTRDVAAQAYKPAAFEPAEDAQRTPLPSTQAMLEDAQAALLQTIRRTRPHLLFNEKDHPRPSSRQPSHSPPTPITPFSAFIDGFSPTKAPEVDSHPVNTQAMFDAFSPFSGPSERRQSVLSRENDTTVASDDEATEYSRSLSAERQNDTRLQHDEAMPSDSETSEHSSDSDRDPLGKELIEHARLSQLYSSVAEPRHDVGAESQTDHDRSRSTSHPADVKVEKIDSPHTQSIEPDEDEKQAVLARVPVSNAFFSMPISEAGLRPTSFENAQRSPSIDIDVTMTDIQENVLGSWDVHEAMRREVEAV